jgi:small-conductance mechanosensitive channel
MNIERILAFELLRLHGVSVTVGALIMAAIIVLVGFAVSSGLQRAVSRAWARRATGDTRNLHAVLRLGHYAVMFGALAVALETVGVNLTTLFAAGAIFAIGIGFAMQNVAQNFVSGVILLLERTIRPGDLLEVDGVVVRVIQMGMRATLVRTRFEEEMIVPNTILVQSTIKNFTLHDPLYRIRTALGVAYESDLRVVFATLEHAAAAFTGRETSRPPVVLLTGFGSSSIDFEVSIWTSDPWNERRTLSDLNRDLWWALKDAGVTIAFPQRDVHFDSSFVDAMRLLAPNDERRAASAQD